MNMWDEYYTKARKLCQDRTKRQKYYETKDATKQQAKARRLQELME